MIEQTYKLNMIPFEEQRRRNYEIPIVSASQYDKELRTLIFELYDGSERFTIPDNAVAYIFGSKPDGNSFQYLMTVEDNTAKIDMQTQMTTVAGCVDCEIVLFDKNTSGARIGSANFKLVVEHCAVGDDADFSRSDMPVIQTLIFGGVPGDTLVKDEDGVRWSSESPTEGYMRYAMYDPEITGTVNSARNALTVNGHTVARNVLANEYTNAEIDQKIEEGGIGGVWGMISGDIANQADLQRELANKVTKVAGKGLSTNDFTDQWRNKLDGIEAGAEVNVQANWDQSVTTADDYIKNKPTIPENTSDLVNDSGFITANQAPVQGVKGSAESSYRTGSVSLSKADIGLSNVDNTSDADKPISTAVQNALNTKQGTLTAGANITIDANNVISASGGGGGGAVDSVNGKTGVVVLDADDVGALPDTTTASDLGAYVKPSSGIPKTDLASAVQTSLDKADTALQTAPVTSVNTKTGAVVLSASDVGAYTLPSGGIPKSDLSSAVQTSLGKADTALQSAPVTSVNSKTGAVSLSASDVGALPDSTTIPTKTSDLTNDSGFLTSAVTTFNGQSGAVTYTAPVTSVDGKTGAVTVMPSGGTTGQVLTKTASGEAWQTPSGGGNVDTVNGIQPNAQKNVQVDVELTQAQYDALPATKLTNNVNYFIKDGAYRPQGGVIDAEGVMYDNTESGLTSDTVQGAIDENASAIEELSAGLIPSQQDVLWSDIPVSDTTEKAIDSTKYKYLGLIAIFANGGRTSLIIPCAPLQLLGTQYFHLANGEAQTGNYYAILNVTVKSTAVQIVNCLKGSGVGNVSLYVNGIK